jgi:hypothetical protein
LGPDGLFIPHSIIHARIEESKIGGSDHEADAAGSKPTSELGNQILSKDREDDCTASVKVSEYLSAQDEQTKIMLMKLLLAR